MIQASWNDRDFEVRDWKQQLNLDGRNIEVRDWSQHFRLFFSSMVFLEQRLGSSLKI
jgi:hypothetical protein